MDGRTRGPGRACAPAALGSLTFSVFCVLFCFVFLLFMLDDSSLDSRNLVMVGDPEAIASEIDCAIRLPGTSVPGARSVWSSSEASAAPMPSTRVYMFKYFKKKFVQAGVPLGSGRVSAGLGARPPAASPRGPWFPSEALAGTGLPG